jgi:glycosyltransferase involved in cell wall biosynthesis
MSTKILTVVYDLERGGTQRAAQNFALGYRRLGLDSRVLAVSGLGHRTAELRNAGVPVEQAEQESSPMNAFPGWLPDVVHLHSHGLRAETVRALRDRWPQAIVVETNVFAVPSPWLADLTVSFQLTPWCQWRYGTRGGNLSRSVVVPNPVSVTEFTRDASAGERTRFELGIPQTALVFGRIGQPEPNKWHSVTIEAFEAIADRRPDAFCVLIGASPDITRQALASRHKSRIRLVPNVQGDDALAAHYSAMDVFLHAAHQGETFGYVLTEAMLCEVPVVTLQTPWADNSQGDVVGDRIGGIVTKTAREFISAAARLAQDPALREQYGQAGRQRIISKFELQQVAQEALDAIGAAHDGISREVLRYRRSSTLPILAPIRGVEPWRWFASVTFNTVLTRRASRVRQQQHAN